MDNRNILNTFKIFKDVPSKIDRLSKLNVPFKEYDEPTYLTFKISFLLPPEFQSWNNTQKTNFDYMPHPLFNPIHFGDYQKFGKEGDQAFFMREQYSTYQFLLDQNEIERAHMLKEFVNKWSELETYYNYYFQKISGLEKLLLANPQNQGRRAKDVVIGITMLESLDLKVSHLLNMYRKIAWDDTYQRWILPDMMRYFTIKIMVSEFRNFHKPQLPSENIDTINNNFPNKSESIILKAYKNIKPLYILELNQCEFDITSLNKVIPDSLDITKADMHNVSFNVKVGNFTEKYYNPLLDSFYADIVLNGIYRGDGQKILSSKNTQTQLAKGQSAVNDLYEDFGDQVTGDPTVQYAIKDQNLKNAAYNPEDIRHVDPNDPTTWVGNTFTIGKAMAKNFIKSGIDKLKMTNIPKLNFSVNDTIAAIQSKNVFDIYGLVKRSILMNKRENAELGVFKPITENSYKESLPEDYSQATDKEGYIKGENKFERNIKQKLEKAELNKLSDFSQATDKEGYLDKKTYKIYEKDQSKPIESANLPKPKDFSQAINKEGKIYRDGKEIQEYNIENKIEQPDVYSLSNEDADNVFKEILFNVINTPPSNTDEEKMIAAAKLILNDEGYWNKVDNIAQSKNLWSEIIDENKYIQMTKIEGENNIINSNITDLYDFNKKPSEELNGNINDQYIMEGKPSSELNKDINDLYNDDGKRSSWNKTI